MSQILQKTVFSPAGVGQISPLKHHSGSIQTLKFIHNKELYSLDSVGNIVHWQLKPGSESKIAVLALSTFNIPEGSLMQLNLDTDILTVA